MPTVVGLDTSLTSTGLVVLRDNGASCQTITSKGKADDDLAKRQARLDKLAGRVVSETLAAVPDLVVIEAPAFASNTGHAHDRSGLWWLVVFSLMHKGKARVLEVTPQQRMMYATGSGRSSKDVVLTDAVRRYTSIPVSGNDQADALILAAIGRRLLGAPIDDPLPQTHLRALAKLRLP